MLLYYEEDKIDEGFIVKLRKMFLGNLFWILIGAKKFAIVLILIFMF